MSKFDTIKAAAILKGNRAGLIVKKFSPEILVGVGVVSVVAGTALSIKATLNIDVALEKSREDLAKIDELRQMQIEGKVEDIEYTGDDEKKDMVIINVQRAVSVAKHYAPAIGLTSFGILAMLSAHKIVSKRNVALVMAYKGMETAFSDYKNRVLAEFGEETERRLRHGITVEEYEEKQLNEETGRNRTVKLEKEVVDPNGYSVYARFFDELNQNYVKTPEYNLMFLKAQQNFANDMLQARGHLFLNEVYKALGMKHTQEGSIVGWVMNDGGDNFVDFGLYGSGGNPRKAVEFVNGDEPAILLDFNVDGVIYDKI